MQKLKRKKPPRFPFYLLLAVAPFLAFVILVRTIDADKHRAEVAALLGNVLGREVTLNGPILFSAGLDGIKITVQDADIANIQPASRPVMAHIGLLELGMDTPSLMRGLLPVKDLSLHNADILFEENASEAQSTSGDAKPVWPLFPQLRLSLKVRSVNITDSRLALLKDGKQGALNVSSLRLEMTDEGVLLNLSGSVSGTPVVADIKTSMKDVVSPAPFTIDAAGNYGPWYIAALGKIDLSEGRAELTAYEVSKRDTKLTGAVDATWASGRPILHGTLKSDYVSLADLTAEPEQELQLPGAENPIFSTEAFPLDSLRSVDADIAMMVGRIPFGKGALDQVQARLTLLGGNLTLAPIKARLGGIPVDLRAVVDASRAPAQFDFGMIAHDIDFAELQRIAGLPAFMTGKAGANIRLGGGGDTPHDVAANLAGVISVSAEKGAISAPMLSEASSLLASVFTSGGNNTALNCLAARFIVRNGVMTDNGILIDSPISTIMGKGQVDLGAEALDFTWKARPKVAGIAGLIPVLQVSGPLNGLTYSVNARNIVKHVVNSILEPDLENIPYLDNPPGGENACGFALDHPKRTPATTVLRSDPWGKIENIGKSLIGGLFNE